MNSRPSVSIIIPTLNEERYLPRLLAAIRAQTRQPLEIIVSDGGSTDATQAIAAAAGVNIVQSMAGVANQRNAGVRAASADTLVFMDADVSFDPDFLQKFCKMCDRRSLSVACPFFVADSRNPVLQVFYALLSTVFWITQRIRPTGGGNCILVRSAIFKKVGGFVPSYTFEDIAFIRDAARNGRYGVVRTSLRVSVRRFQRDGILSLMAVYMIYGTLTFFGSARLANRLQYRFGNYAE